MSDTTLHSFTPISFERLEPIVKLRIEQPEAVQEITQIILNVIDLCDNVVCG